MKCRGCHCSPLAGARAVRGTAHAALDNAAAEAMMKKDGCAACHAIDKKIVGPSYVDVAAKYKGDKGAAAKLDDQGQGRRLGRLGTGADAAERRRRPDADIKDTGRLDPDAQEIG